MIGTHPERTTAAALLTFGVFQAALAAGAPWGRAAYGGTHRGTLPGHLRAISGIASLVYCGGAVLGLRGAGAPHVRRRSYTALSVFMGVGVIANGASRSRVERALWTPLTALTAVSSWRARSRY